MLPAAPVLPPAPPRPPLPPEPALPPAPAIPAPPPPAAPPLPPRPPTPPAPPLPLAPRPAVPAAPPPPAPVPPTPPEPGEPPEPVPLLPDTPPEPLPPLPDAPPEAFPPLPIVPPVPVDEPPVPPLPIAPPEPPLAAPPFPLEEPPVPGEPPLASASLPASGLLAQEATRIVISPRPAARRNELARERRRMGSFRRRSWPPTIPGNLPGPNATEAVRERLPLIDHWHEATAPSVGFHAEHPVRRGRLRGLGRLFRQRLGDGGGAWPTNVALRSAAALTPGRDIRNGGVSKSAALLGELASLESEINQHSAHD